MTEPTTSNIGLIVPNTGDLVGTWGPGAIVPDYVALDGYQGGVQTLSLSNVNVTLTSPAGFTPTPSAGPTQAQNAVLRLTGTQTGNVVITLPMPGYYIVENLCTGNIGWVVILQSILAANKIISIDRGMRHHVYCDGQNVYFCNLGPIAQMEFWAGYNAIPAWVLNCTDRPYLLCDGSIYGMGFFPFLGARLGATFGGDGVTQFGVPDLRGRVPLAYDGTGSRITAAGCGLNGTSLGAALDQQTVTLNTSQMPAHTHANSLSDPGHLHSVNPAVVGGGSGAAGGPGNQFSTINTGGAFTGITINNASQGGNLPHNNVQPSQVAGIWVIRSA